MPSVVEAGTAGLCSERSTRWGVERKGLSAKRKEAVKPKQAMKRKRVEAKRKAEDEAKR